MNYLFSYDRYEEVYIWIDWGGDRCGWILLV